MKHTFERYCKDYENIENYEKAKADNFKGWHCHHRLETHNSDGERRLVDITQAELIALNMYYHRPAEELIFLTTREHNAIRKVSVETRRKLSESRKGKKHSEESKKKIGAASKGNKYALGCKRSEETKKKMREAKKNMSEETKKKIGAAKKGNTYTKGKHWYNNGKINTISKECPDGFTPGRLLI